MIDAIHITGIRITVVENGYIVDVKKHHDAAKNETLVFESIANLVEWINTNLGARSEENND